MIHLSPSLASCFGLRLPNTRSASIASSMLQLDGSLFGEYPDSKNIQSVSKKCSALVVIKGSVDYICQSGECFELAGGNAGMTKGGTGDILSGLLAGLLTKNNTLTSAKIAVYINKKAGESLFKELGYFYSATDLIGSIQKELKNII